MINWFLIVSKQLLLCRENKAQIQLSNSKNLTSSNKTKKRRSEHKSIYGISDVHSSSNERKPYSNRKKLISSKNTK